MTSVTSSSDSDPIHLVPLPEAIQVRIAADFAGLPNGIVSANDWGWKLSATVTERELRQLRARPLDRRDVWVVTPPKCGTTWTQEMVWLIANDLDYEGAKTLLTPIRWRFVDLSLFSDKQYLSETSYRRRPLYDDGGHPVPADDAPQDPPRFTKCHLPLSLCPPRLLDTCRVVYVARNPKDACVSYYHHCRLVRRLDFCGDFESFMEYFMNGHTVMTPFIEHMLEAWKLRHHPNMCFLFYEDMKKDLKSQIRKVAAFLVKSLTDGQVDRLAEHLHIDNFKSNKYVNEEIAKDLGSFYPHRGNFIRRGKTGDWKNHFTPEMSQKFDNWMTEKLKGTDLKFTMELERQD